MEISGVGVSVDLVGNVEEMSMTCPQHGKMSPNPRDRIKCPDIFVFSGKSHVHKMSPDLSHDI